MSSKEYFGRIAGEWDQMRQGFFSEEVRERAYEMAQVEKGRLAADIGAGTGFITEGLVDRGVRVIAVDQSEEMLAEMKRKFSGSHDIDYRIGDAESLPLLDGEVDYVFANMFLHHVEEPEGVIKEMVRIMKPGGKLIITDLDEHEHEFLRTEQNDRWMGFDRDDVKKWLLSAGLKNVLVDCVGTENVLVDCVGTEYCSSSSCGCQDAKISIFAAVGETVV